MTGFYIHIPFCEKRCDYCDFYSETGVDDLTKENYLKALLKNLEYLKKDHPGSYKKIDTIYIGGGTPFMIGIKRLERLIDYLVSSISNNIREITVEVNPVYSDLSDVKYLCGKKKITRLSIGVQSFFSDQLKWLGRSYYKEIDSVLDSLLAIEDIDKNIDLIVGQPGFSIYDFKQRFKALKISERCDHISVYMLNVNKRFGKKDHVLSDDEIEDRSVDDIAGISSFLKEKGYLHYEISSFAKEGFECLHNLHYWNLDDYLSIGADSTMKIDGVFQRYDKLNSYIKSPIPLKDSYVKTDLYDYIMMRLRLKKGIALNDDNLSDIKNLRQTCNFIYNKYREYVIFDNENFSLNEKGFLFYNTILSELFKKLEELDEVK